MSVIPKHLDFTANMKECSPHMKRATLCDNASSPVRPLQPRQIITNTVPFTLSNFVPCVTFDLTVTHRNFTKYVIVE